MHIFNNNSHLPVFKTRVNVICPEVVYSSNIGTDERGSMFVTFFLHDAIITMVKLYLELRYQGFTDLIPLYAEIHEDVYNYFSSDIDCICCCLFDEAAMATDYHPEWAETVLDFFNHDSGIITSACMDLYRGVHASIFYPVMSMVEKFHSKGLTLDICDYQEMYNTIIINMEVTDNELSHAGYSDASYSSAPFRSGNPVARTVADVGGFIYGSDFKPLYPLIHRNTNNIQHRTQSS